MRYYFYKVSIEILFHGKFVNPFATSISLSTVEKLTHICVTGSEKVKQKSIFFSTEQESKTLRINDIHELIHQLPESNFEMLAILILHLRK